MQNIPNLSDLFSFDFENKDMTSERIRKIRRSYNITQVSFAKLIMIKYETYKSWELGRRIPSSPGYAILTIAEKYPDVFLKHRGEIINKINKNNRVF